MQRRMIRDVVLLAVIAWLLAVLAAWTARVMQRELFAEVYRVLPIGLVGYYLAPFFAVGVYALARRQHRVDNTLLAGLALLLVFSVSRVLFWWDVARDAARPSLITLDAAVAARPFFNALVVLTGATSYAAIAISVWRLAVRSRSSAVPHDRGTDPGVVREG
jgi:hypothetical protein